MAEVSAPDICVIGGGPGGIALALGAAALGVPVVLVEKGRMGGSDLLTGSIPSKAFLFAAGHHEILRRGPALGVSGAPLQVNFAKIREHVASVEASVAPSLSAERLTALGVDVISAPAQFTGRRTVVAGDVTIRARRFVVATGGIPVAPDLPGLDSVDYMTADSAFDVVRKPSHLLILGADSRGLEVAQAYARLGVDTTVIDTAKALTDDDPELVRIVLDRLQAEGVRVRDGVTIAGIGRRKGGIRVTLVDRGEEIPVDGSHLLVMSGRAPNVAGLGLDAAGVAYDRNGVIVDRLLRTTNRRVYAVGDVVAGPALASRATYHADRVLRSILYRLPVREHSAAVAAVTFTDPALARVGLSEADARRRYAGVRTARIPFAGNERAQTERMPAGMIKVVTNSRGRILGASIVGHEAGEMIALWSLAIARRMNISAMLGFVLPYPSRAAIVREAAVAFLEKGELPGWHRRLIALLRRFG